MNGRTALVAHPYPIVVDALAALVATAGFTVSRASDAAGVSAGLAACPDVAFVAAPLRAAANDTAATRTIVIDDDAGTEGMALTAPVARIAAAIAALSGTAEAPPPLTRRERDVAQLVAAGQRNRGIAETLGISEGTVKMHLHNVYGKLGLESRTQLAMALRGTA